PAGFVKVPSAGFLVIGYRSNRSAITLEPEKFEKYLGDEGLDAVLEARAARNERGKPGNEGYSRCAKSLVAGGGSGGPGFDRVVGLTLELVAESDPQKLAAEGKMRLRLLHEGRPLAKALVKMTLFDDPTATLSSRTGKDGRVSFPVARK